MAIDTEPTIEQIEAEIFKAKFTEDPAEQYLSTRAKQRMLEADIVKSKDERVRAAFLVGYKLALSERAGPWKGFLIGLGLAALIFAYVIVASQSY